MKKSGSPANRSSIWTGNLKLVAIRRTSLALLALAIGGGTAILHSEPGPVASTPFFAALSVADAEASAEWYGEVFGYAIHRSIEVPDRGVRVRLLRSDQGFLELVEIESAEPLRERLPDLGGRYQVHGVFKIGVRVVDLSSAIERMEQHGIALRGDVITEEDGSMRSAQIEDPDGTIIQLFEILEPAPSDERSQEEPSP